MLSIWDAALLAKEKWVSVKEESVLTESKQDGIIDETL